MQGLNLLPQLNSSLQEEGRSHGSSSPWEEVQGHSEVNGAGTTWGHRGAAGWGWRRAVAKHPTKGCQGRLTARQGTGWILMLL